MSGKAGSDSGKASVGSARFVEDGLWYEAVLLSLRASPAGNAEGRVVFSRYGNEQDVTRDDVLPLLA